MSRPTTASMPKDEDQNTPQQHNDRFALRRRRQTTESCSHETHHQHQRHITAKLNRTKTIGAVSQPIDYASFLCGLLAGVSQAGILNPYDRALYLSVKNHSPFLSLENWRSPYTGFFQSIGGRALQGGLYFPLEHLFLRLVEENDHWRSLDPQVTNFAAGTAAGAANAVVLNPLSAVKYKTWVTNRGMWTEAWGMLQKAGGSVRPFVNGLLPTLYRDVVFGGCYTWLRLQIQWWLHPDAEQQKPHEQWEANMVAAALATVASGPFNYVRNVQYSTSSRREAKSTWRVLRKLARETVEQDTVFERLHFLQTRLRIGWGTARVALGMAFGHAVYDWLHESASSPLAHSR